jgi:phosphatidylglycerol:prolipoprotein diacylglycerol transferase
MMIPWWPEDFPVHPHLLFESLAYFVGYQVFARDRARSDVVLDGYTRLQLAVAAVLGGALGSKLSGLLEDPALWATPLELLSGKSIVGALLGGLFATELAKLRLGVTLATGDLWVRPLWVGMAIGRVGCFLAGVTDGTHGLPSTLPWAMDLGDGIPRHPTALYEIVFLVGLGLLLSRLSLPAQGDKFKLFLSAYLGFRLLVEELKPGPAPWMGLSGIQGLCLVGLGYYAIWMGRRLRR